LVPEECDCERVHILGVLWESSYQGNALYNVDGEVMGAKEASVCFGYDQTVFLDKMRPILHSFALSLRRLHLLFRDAEREAPRCVRISHDIPSGTTDYEIIFEPVTSNDRGFGDVLEEWRTELAADTASDDREAFV
jgi:hypothetical protein